MHGLHTDLSDMGSGLPPCCMHAHVLGPTTPDETVAPLLSLLPQYMFSIHWPSVWAAKGYTKFEVGFEQEDQAQEWREALTASIGSLKERHQASGKIGNHQRA